MEPIHLVSRLFSLLIATLELQINVLSLTRGHRMYMSSVLSTQYLLETLINFTDELEQDFVSEIERSVEVELGKSAAFMKAIAEARRRMPDLEILQELSVMAAEGHKKYTSVLAHDETVTEDEWRRKFSEIRQRLLKLKERLAEQ